MGSDSPTGVTGATPERIVPGRVRLDRVDIGHCGIVCEVEAGEDEIEQLKAMGVCLGRRVMLVRRGDPMILRVLGSRIGVSSRLAARVTVATCSEDSCAGE